MSGAASLYLDPAIRDWVLFPISLVMILVGVLRSYVLLLLQSKPKPQTRAQIREQRALTRSQLLRTTSPNSPVPPPFYHTISQNLKQAFDDGVYLKDGPPPPPSKKIQGAEDEMPQLPPNPFTDPSSMDSMMSHFKTQTVVMIPQMVIMAWVNFFFSGFVAIKLPFPLTLGFKPMMQRGISTPDMDTRWVSSLSWYFLNFFGLNGVYRLLLGNDNDATMDLQQMSGMPNMAAAAPGVPQDFTKLFKQEKENLEFDQGLYKWIGEDVENRVLRKYGKLPPINS